MRSLIIMGGLVQDQEGLYPYYRLQEEGEVDVWWTTPENFKGIQGVDFKKAIQQEHLLEDAPNVNDYDLLVIPGGAKLMEKQRLMSGVIRFIEDWCWEGKPLASICHGAQVLIEADVIRGKSILGYYSIKKDIQNAGGHWVEAPIAVSDNIISSAHYHDMAEWLAVAIKVVNDG